MDEDMDVDKLLHALENEDNSSLLNLTTEKINEMKKLVLSDLHISKSLLEEYMYKLREYKYVDEMDDLKCGYYIRWIPITNPEELPLKQGAIFCELKIIDDGVSLVCKGFGFKKRLFHLKFDENLIFQKMTLQELVLLSALDHLAT